MNIEFGGHVGEHLSPDLDARYFELRVFEDVAFGVDSPGVLAGRHRMCPIDDRLGQRNGGRTAGIEL